LIVDGSTAVCATILFHEDRKGVTDWIAKHNRYATRETQELVQHPVAPNYREIDARLFGTQAQRKRWLRYKVWNRLPPLIRPIFLFFLPLCVAGWFSRWRSAFISTSCRRSGIPC